MHRLGAVVGLLAVLSGAAYAQNDDSFPPGLCASLPKTQAEEASGLVSHFPDLAGGDFRDVTAPAADALLDGAVDRISALELFTEPPARGNCVFVISGPVINHIDSKYDLVLLTPFSGTDVDGKPYHMNALIVGKSRLYIIYDRDHIQYKDGQTGNTISMRGIIKEKIPEQGTLEMDGVSSSFGPINRLRQVSATQVEVRVLLFTQDYPLKNITRRTAAPPASVVSAQAAGAARALAYLQSLPSAERISAWMESR